MWYFVGAVLAFVLLRLYIYRDKVADAIKKAYAEKRRRDEERKKARDAQIVENMLKLSRNLSNLTREDLSDINKVREALKI